MNTASIYEVEFINSGAVGFPEENALYYLRDEALEKMAPTIIGCPVYLTHESKTPVGYVSSIHKKDNSKYEVTMSIFSEEADRCITNGWDFSSAYYIKEFNKDVNINSVNYDYEVLNGSYDHIAIVKNPRYNENNFRKLNSLGGKMIGFLKSNSIKKKNIEPDVEHKAIQNEVEARTLSDKSFVIIDGTRVGGDELISFYREAKEVKENEVNMLSPSDIVDIDGDHVSVSYLIELFKQNGVQEEIKEKEELKASEVVAKPSSFEALKKAVNSIPNKTKEIPSYIGLDERLKAGRERY